MQMSAPPGENGTVGQPAVVPAMEGQGREHVLALTVTVALAVVLTVNSATLIHAKVHTIT